MNNQTIYNAEPKEISRSAIDLLKSRGYVVVDNLEGVDLSSVTGLFVRTYTKVDALYISKFPNLKFVLRAGVGLDNIDLIECKRRGIQVFNAPGSNADAVAEYVLTMSLYALRAIGPQIKQVQNKSWRSSAYVGQGLSTKTFGLIGCGHAGRALATKLNRLGVECLAYDPYVTEEIMQTLGIVKLDLVDLLKRADIVVIMLPLTQETAGIMSSTNLASMKQGSMLINVSRGEMIDEAALIEHIQSGHLSTAILDVVVGEPIVSQTLLQEPNIIITPHIAGYTKEANENIALRAVQNFLL